MSKDDALRIAMCLSKIAMLSDDSTLGKIKPSLDEIETIVLKEVRKEGGSSEQMG